MTYVPHTTADREHMLRAIGVRSVDDLFAAIKPELRLRGDLRVPPGLDEPGLLRHMEELGARNRGLAGRASFLGGGAWDHYVPALVDHLAGRSEFVTAYTPYQAEASQGLLQAAFEFQTLMARLTGLEVSNASLYDGGTALVEASFMAAHIAQRGRIVVTSNVHPEYRQVLKTYHRHSGLEVREVQVADGRIDAAAVREALSGAAALVLPNPGFTGALQDLSDGIAAAHSAGALAIAVVDPISLALVQTPAEAGADIAVGEGQPLGNPVNYGGPALGFIAARKEHVRQVPGRIVGETQDAQGRRGFVLTLQTREQHIRREKASSNICTNQALLALRASVYLTTLGPAGLREVAARCLAGPAELARRIAAVPGYEPLDPGVPRFRDFPVRCPAPAARINRQLAQRGLVGGLDLGRFDATLKNVLLLSVTERHTSADFDALVEALKP